MRSEARNLPCGRAGPECGASLVVDGSRPYNVVTGERLNAKYVVQRAPKGERGRKGGPGRGRDRKVGRAWGGRNAQGKGSGTAKANGHGARDTMYANKSLGRRSEPSTVTLTLSFGAAK